MRTWRDVSSERQEIFPIVVRARTAIQMALHDMRPRAWYLKAGEEALIISKHERQYIVLTKDGLVAKTSFSSLSSFMGFFDPIS